MRISEIFYSVQAEGASTGTPAVFIRLASCNLRCGIDRGVSLARKTQEEIEAQQSSSATWVCDTMAVWLRGTEWSCEQVAAWMAQHGLVQDVCTGRVHVVWTGGEPTLPVNADEILLFDQHARQHMHRFTPYYEVETNGTQMIADSLFSLLSQINCSPKLSNSAQPRSRRVNAAAIERIATHNNSTFKFVVSGEADLVEALTEYPFIPQERIIIMPALCTREKYHDAGEMIYELAKKYRLRAINRGHISAWNKKTGV